MAKQKESLEMYLSQEQIEQIKALPEEEQQQAIEDALGIRRFKNGAVDLTTVPGKKGDFFRKKELLLNPERVRGEDGLVLKRFGKDNYFWSTCPYCGCEEEHEGMKFKYSKKTQRLIYRDVALMIAVVVATLIKALNWILAMIAILLITMDMSKHTERKMYYTVKCRKCGMIFPLEEDKLEELKENIRKQKEAEAAEDAGEEDEEEEASEDAPDEPAAEPEDISEGEPEEPETEEASAGSSEE